VEGVTGNLGKRKGNLLMGFQEERTLEEKKTTTH